MLTALIMAGGRGTRFWPASTEDKPKQFLSLTTENTMIQETVRRLLHTPTQSIRTHTPKIRKKAIQTPMKPSQTTIFPLKKHASEGGGWGEKGKIGVGID